MSYILEALKKAQAERQIGSTPGIHDAPGPAPAALAAPGKARLWIAIGAALLLAAGGVAAMRALVGPEPQAAAPAPAPVLAAAPPAPAVMPAPAPAPAPVAAAAVASVELVQKPVPPTPKPAPSAPELAPPAPELPADEALPTLAGLPTSVAAGIPRVTLGGYIYSPVPSERLLLVDKDLRREGEQVAPGLVLEKLLPSAAVMNYRGTRFRMPY